MTVTPPLCEERNEQRAEEEQGTREETDRRKARLPACQVDWSLQMKDRTAQPIRSLSQWPT